MISPIFSRMTGLGFLGTLGFGPLLSHSIAQDPVVEPVADRLVEVVTGTEPVLDARAVVLHEWMDDSDPLSKLDRVMRVLTEQPTHPLALEWMETVESIPPGGDVEGLVHSILSLREKVTDPRAHTRLGGWLRALEWSSSASGMPLDLGEDLYPDWFQSFWSLGPLGALNDPEPLWTRRDANNDPESKLKPSYQSDWGTDVSWRPLERTRRRFRIPGNEQPYQSGGCVFFLSGTELEAGRGFLEVSTRESFRVLWNGEAVYFRKSGSLSQVGDWFRIPVQFRDGLNSLLLVTDGSQWIDVGARVLSESGQPIRPTSPNLDALLALPPIVSNGEATWGPIQVDPRAPLGDSPFESILEGLRALGLGRPDLALAIAAPADSEAHTVWMRMQHSALLQAGYLPDEVRRQRMLALEKQMEANSAALGELGLRAELRRIDRLIEDDKPIEAMEWLDAVRAKDLFHPNLNFRAIRIAYVLDEEGVLAQQEIEAAIQEWPSEPGFVASLSDLYSRNGNHSLAFETGITALRMGSDDLDIIFRIAEGLANRPSDERRDWFLAFLERRAAVDTSSLEWEHRLQDVLMDLGKPDLALERAQVQAQAHAEDFSGWSRLLDLASSRGLTFGDSRFDQAFANCERLEPAYETIRSLRRVAGQPVTADAFFMAFAPDEDFAWQLAEDLEKASAIELLDSGLVYLYPDGSRVGRIHTVTRAEDRSGTEELHEIAASGSPLMARVRKVDGTTREPVMIQESWVMPSLDPGDVVELQYEWSQEAQWGAPVDLGPWRFASIARPFGLSRYVVYVPDGLKVELRSRNFLGSHVTETWGGGTVHILLAEQSPRVEGEPLMPSELEILPWAQFAQDRGLGPVEQQWRQVTQTTSDLPLEISDNLNAWVAELPQGASAEERAALLYARVSDYLVDFDGSANPAQVWFAKRGQPIFVLGALLDRAGISHEWGLLETGVSPELDPNPVQLFKHLGGFQQLILRIQGDNGVLWQIPPMSKGVAFAKLPEAMAGASVMVLEEAGYRFEKLPRESLADSWDTDLELEWTVSPDGAATVQGTWTISTINGAGLRRQLSQAPGPQRDGFVRQYLPSLVPGIDLASYDIVDLETNGANFQVRFEGVRPDFLESAGEQFKADLRLPETGLSTGLGPSQRNWPLAARLSRRDRILVRVHLPVGWQIVGGPGAYNEERPGYRHAVEVQAEGQVWTLERIFTIRGAFLEADEVPGFLGRAAELEREDSRPLLMAPPVTTAPEGQGVGGETPEIPVGDQEEDAVKEEGAVKEPVSEPASSGDGDGSATGTGDGTGDDDSKGNGGAANSDGVF